MNPTTPLRAAAYGRVSTDRQDLSESSQRQALAAFAASQGLSLAPEDVYFDSAKSGRTIWRERPAGKACLEAMSTRCQVLIVHKVDRMGRDAIDLQTTIRDVVALGNRHNVYFAVMGKTFNAREPLGQFIIAMLAWVAQLEWHSIQDRINEGLAVKWDAMESPAHPPYGWDKVEGTRMNKQGRLAPMLEDNPAEQLWLLQILLWRGARLTPEQQAAVLARREGWENFLPHPALASPGWGPEKIANALNELGVPTKRGVQPYRRQGASGELEVAGHTSGRWHERTVHGILTNRWTIRWLAEAAGQKAAAVSGS